MPLYIYIIAQLAMDWSKGVKFRLTVIDETTIMTEAHLVQVWRDDAIVLSIRDHFQLGVISMSNPFVSQLTHPPYIRFVENNWPYAMLLKVMRMTDGLKTLCSDLFYGGELKS